MESFFRKPTKQEIMDFTDLMEVLPISHKEEMFFLSEVEKYWNIRFEKEILASKNIRELKAPSFFLYKLKRRTGLVGDNAQELYDEFKTMILTDIKIIDMKEFRKGEPIRHKELYLIYNCEVCLHGLSFSIPESEWNDHLKEVVKQWEEERKIDVIKKFEEENVNRQN